MKSLRSFIAQQHDLGLYRQRQVSAKGCRDGRLRRWQGQLVVSFSSNDYLGLASDERVIAACVAGAQRYGTGAGASCLVDGYSAAHQALEIALAEFLGRDQALVFSSGYLANLGVVMTLADRHTTLFEDKLNHASLLDAGRLSRARLLRYPHCDLQYLSARLEQTKTDTIVVSDAVFSMDGEIAPLTPLADICAQNDTTLMVDDAHGFGVLGTSGRGSLEHFGLSQEQVPVMVGTFGKALGACGAFVAGSTDLIEALVQKARTYIYTTALAPPLVCAIHASLDIVRSDPHRRATLHKNIALFRQLTREHGIACLNSQTAIQGIVVGSAHAALALSAELLKDGLLVVPMRPPTVPSGSARIRIMLSALHTEEDINQLVQSLTRRSKRYPTLKSKQV